MQEASRSGHMVLKKGITCGGDGHVDAAFSRGARGREFAVGMRHGLEAGGGDTEGEGDRGWRVEDVSLG